MNNPWNRRLGVFSNAVEDLTSRCDRAEFLDLRAVFAERLAGKPASGYVPRSAIRVALDALTLRSQEQVDRKAAKRGLCFTLDGLHLNSKGAETVAETFLRAIARQSTG
jgi:lysophospholipase L1-like esterase